MNQFAITEDRRASRRIRVSLPLAWFGCPEQPEPHDLRRYFNLPTLAADASLLELPKEYHEALAHVSDREARYCLEVLVQHFTAVVQALQLSPTLQAELRPQPLMLSADGCHWQSDTAVETGSYLGMALQVEQSLLLAAAQVTRCSELSPTPEPGKASSGTYQIGCRFTDLAPSAHNVLTRFVIRH